MKFNGAIFSKPQQDQLKENIGNELEKVSAKVDEVDARMLNYKGDWVDGDEYHENDIVTGTDGQLYEVIKAHTSSDTLKPGNTEYYKAMTALPFAKLTISKTSSLNNELMTQIANALNNGKYVYVIVLTTNAYVRVNINGNNEKLYGYTSIIADGFNTFTEYMFVGKIGSVARLYERTATMDNPSSSETPFSAANIAGNVSFVIGA